MSGSDLDKLFTGIDTSSASDSDRVALHKKLKRDMTPTPVKFKRFLLSDGAWLILFISLIVIIMFNEFKYISEIYFLMIYFIYVFNIKKVEILPFKKRKSSGDAIDLNELSPADDKPTKPEGITFFGNEFGTKKEVWFTNSDIRTHCLLFGTTGAGKTEALISFCVNSLNQSSGFIYIDGKGDTSLFAKVFSLLAAYGRLDDLYLINYMTTSNNVQEKDNEYQVFKTSHSVNPFADADADTLTELLVSLLADSGDGMWKGRASVFMSALLKVLVYLRDQGQLLLDIDAIRKHFVLDKIIELSFRNDIPEHYVDGLRQYVINLPGFKAPTAKQPNPKQEETVGEQHGYITMQFTETFGLLSDTYGKIMRVQLADIDFFDVVINRRVLVVLLPALQKSKQNLGNLGRIIIASIKNMMATTLGSKVEGSKTEVLDAKPTNAPSPFLTIFDEFGYYAVENSAVMPAQARSLGFFMVFAGQDFQAFKNGAKDESYSIAANCAIKICMKLEDTDDTYEMFRKAAGEDYFAESSNFEKEDGKNKQSNNINVNKGDILRLKDLKNQNSGEGTVLFKEYVRRIKMFYANPKLSKFYTLNSFIEVEPPSGDEIKEMKTSQKSLKMNFEKIYNEPKLFAQTTNKSIEILKNNEIATISNILNNLYRNEENAFEKSLKAYSFYINKIEEVDLEIEDEINLNNQEEINEEESSDSSESEINFKSDILNKDQFNKVKDLGKKLEALVKTKSKEFEKNNEGKENIFDVIEIDFLGISKAIVESENNINKKLKSVGINSDGKKDIDVEHQTQNILFDAVAKVEDVPKDDQKRIDSINLEIEKLVNNLLD